VERLFSQGAEQSALIIDERPSRHGKRKDRKLRIGTRELAADFLPFLSSPRGTRDADARSFLREDCRAIDDP